MISLRASKILRLASLVLVLLFASAFALMPKSASAQASNPLVVPINFVSAAGSFIGTFTLQGFNVVNDQLMAVGTLAGSVLNATGGLVGTVNQIISLPVNLLQTTGTCEILHLTLGPLDLNLLGLTVHLDRVVLDITAQAAPGNLLGNLLCAVAHLLDKGGPLTALVSHLNHIVGILTGL